MSRAPLIVALASIAAIAGCGRFGFGFGDDGLGVDAGALDAGLAVDADASVPDAGEVDGGDDGGSGGADAGACFGVRCGPRRPTVSIGEEHTCASNTLGEVYCWGSNAVRMGQPDVVRASYTPLRVSGLADIRSVECGRSSCCAVDDDGAVFCWGERGGGALGDGMLVGGSATPVRVTVMGGSPLTDVVDLAVSHGFACAVDGSKRAWCWGYNAKGELGDGTMASGSRAYAGLVPTSGPVLDVGVGRSHACAALESGALECWGEGVFGKLGTGDTESRALPTAVAGIADAAEFAGGHNSSCVRTRSGQVRCWGAGYGGQLGTGRSEEIYLPSSPLVGISGAVEMASGEGHVLVRLEDGTLRGFGPNLFGEVGVGSTVSALSPAAVIGLGEVEAIGTGYFSSCAWASGALYCWGWYAGGIGENGKRGTPTPSRVLGVSGATQLSAGAAHACVRLSTGRAMCWGWSELGQLGTACLRQYCDARLVVDQEDAPLEGIAAVVAGFVNSCARTDDGRVYCWGHGAEGQLGDGLSTNVQGRAVEVSSFTEATAAPALARLWSCSLASTAGQPITCWGSNRTNAFGGAVAMVYPTPTAGFLDLVGTPTRLVTGAFTSCVSLSSGGVACVGDNSQGTIGDGTFDTARPRPVAVAGLTNVADLQSHPRARHVCARRTDGTLACWGANDYGQLGVTTAMTRQATPVEVPVSDVSEVSVGGDFVIVRSSTGVVQVWGDNHAGQLGDGTFTERHAPVVGPTLTDVTALAAGGDFVCALHADGTVSCWGGRERGQRGDGEPVGAILPTIVPGIAR